MVPWRPGGAPLGPTAGTLFGRIPAGRRSWSYYPKNKNRNTWFDRKKTNKQKSAQPEEEPVGVAGDDPADLFPVKLFGEQVVVADLEIFQAFLEDARVFGEEGPQVVGPHPDVRQEADDGFDLGAVVLLQDPTVDGLHPVPFVDGHSQLHHLLQ